MTENAGITPESLIAEISAAFDGVQREDGTTLHEGEELDCHGSPEELQQARQLDTDTRWQDIPDEWIGEFSSAFHFMNSKGFRYYVPKVMIWHFKRTHWSEAASAGTVQSILMDTSSTNFSAFFNLLTEPQRRATARWLRFYIHSYGYKPAIIDDMRKLMGSPWGQYIAD